MRCASLSARQQHGPRRLIEALDRADAEEDLLDFYRQLPNPDRQFVVLPGAAHALVFGHNRHQLWHIVHAFLTMPARRDRQ